MGLFEFIASSQAVVGLAWQVPTYFFRGIQPRSRDGR